MKEALYGHKIVNGGIASVTLDGEKVGGIDYYQAGHENKLLLFETELLAEGEHTIMVTAIGEHNEKAGDTLEIAIDYAEVTMSEKAMKPESLELSKDSITLDTDGSYTPEYTVLPSYAADCTALWYSDAPDVAEVDEETGVITAVSEGDTKIHAYVEGN